jgi:hypothetical protein
MTEQEEHRARRKALKDEYGDLYERVSRILFRHDPMGINFETNEDEYEPEVDTILSRLVSARTVRDVRRIVHEEMVRWFDPAEVGDVSRYRAIGNEVWQAQQKFATTNAGALARAAWSRGKDLDAGRIVYEALSREERARWAAGILRVACSRLRAPEAVSRILVLAEDSSRWLEGHKAFGAVRDLTLQQQRTEGVGRFEGPLLEVAEKVAKVVYNASRQSAPFDHDAGWRIAPSARALIVAVDDAGFSKEVEVALFDVSTARAPSRLPRK